MNYERIAANLQRKISDLVSRYEGDLAVLQEQATQEIERLTEEIANLKAELEASSVVVDEDPSEKPGK